MADLQTTILQKLVHDEKFCRTVLPFIKPDFFKGEHRHVYKLALKFIGKYNKLPTSSALSIDLQNSPDAIPEDELSGSLQLIEDLKNDPEVEEQWLLEHTEQWCKNRSVENAVIEAWEIIKGKHTKLSISAVPDLLQKAISINFDPSVGHDYMEDYNERWDFYHRDEERIPFDLEMLNKITKGGLPRKSITVFLGGPNVGKSLVMCHLASAALMQGRNVLYITLEMAEERIAERIDANLMNVSIDELNTLPKEMFETQVNKIATKTVGKLIIKEYPTASAHSGHFRALLNELKLKKNFVPDIIFIDYLNICTSARISGIGNGVNTYSLVKAVIEELRGLAVEFNVPMVTATQTTRSGYSDSDVDIDDTSESFGVPATADAMLAIINTEELEKLGQYMIKQLKNRFADKSKHKRFVVGVDRAKMRLYDVEEKAQNLLQGSSSQPVQGSPMASHRPTQADFSSWKV